MEIAKKIHNSKYTVLYKVVRKVTEVTQKQNRTTASYFWRYTII